MRLPKRRALHACPGWILGHNSVVDSDPRDHCSAAPYAVWLHVISVVVVNVVALVVIFQGSAVMFFVAGAAVVPLTLVFSSVVAEHVGLPPDLQTEVRTGVLNDHGP
jgi:hypothetical protein